LSGPMRLMFFVAGILLLIPGHAPQVPMGALLNLIGLVASVLLIGYEYFGRKKDGTPRAQPVSGGGE
jgi:hypothetical protein